MTKEWLITSIWRCAGTAPTTGYSHFQEAGKAWKNSKLGSHIVSTIKYGVLGCINFVPVIGGIAGWIESVGKRYTKQSSTEEKNISTLRASSSSSNSTQEARVSDFFKQLLSLTEKVDNPSQRSTSFSKQVQTCPAEEFYSLLMNKSLGNCTYVGNFGCIKLDNGNFLLIEKQPEQGSKIFIAEDRDSFSDAENLCNHLLNANEPITFYGYWSPIDQIYNNRSDSPTICTVRIDNHQTITFE